MKLRPSLGLNGLNAFRAPRTPYAWRACLCLCARLPQTTTWVFCCLIFLTCATCTFTPGHKYINPISAPPSTIQVFVNMNDPNFSDPYALKFPTTFSFTIYGTSHPIIGLELSLDGVPFSALSADQPIQFTIDPYPLADGAHSVKILIKIATESGSLAERLRAAYY